MRRRLALVAVGVLALGLASGCNTARVVGERHELAAETAALRAQLERAHAELRAQDREMQDLRGALAGSVPRDCVATLSVPGEPRLGSGCVSLDELLAEREEHFTVIAGLVQSVSEAEARRSAASCLTAAGSVAVGFWGPGLVECAEALLAELASPR